jgi:GntR family transcriptional regulator
VNTLVDKESYIPYYLQIYNNLKDKIELKVYKPNEILPSENELVEEFKVTRVTVRNAIKKLKDEGRIYTEKGKGSYVNPPKIIQKLGSIYSLGTNLNEDIYKLETTVLDMYTELSSETIREKLELEAKDQVIVIKIVKKIGNMPVVAQTSYLPLKNVPGFSIAELSDSPIYTILREKYNINILKAKEYLDPIVADDCYSKLLEVELNTPLFLTERITYTDGDKPIEFRRCVIRSDKFRFSVELQ